MRMVCKMRRLGDKQHLLSNLVGYLLMSSMLLILSCQSDISSPKEYGAWAFSGHVVDGNTQQRISNVSITYFDKDGVSQVATTDSSGEFFINALPFGDRSFKFTYNRTNKTEPAYTQKIVVVSSYTESRSIDGLLGDISKVVTLYPLTSSVSGEIFVKLSGSEKIVPAVNVDVNLSYKDTNLVNTTPAVFTATTDSIGRFSFVSLPLAPGASLAINSYAIKGTTYTADAVAITSLFKGKDVSLGKIYLTAKDTSQFLISRVRSNVLSTDGFGLTGIPLDIKLWYVLPVIPLSSNVTVTIDGGGSPNATVRVKGDTVFVNPLTKFTYDTLITVSIACLDSAKNHITFTFDGSKQFRTQKNLASQVRSNVLSADGYGLTGVATNVKLWYILPVVPLQTGLDVIITGGGDPNSTVRVSRDTVFIVPEKKFSFDTLITVSITGVDTAKNHFEFTFDGNKRFKTEKNLFSQVRSNVLTADGYGLTGIPIDAKLWYVLPVVPLASSVEAVISGSGVINSIVHVKRDTVFIDHIEKFNYDTEISIVIMGMDTSRNHFEFSFSGIQEFRTEKGIYPIASNAWQASGVAQRNFKLNDTLWVQYSSILDTDVNKFDWTRSAAIYAIYGKGSAANANVWVKGDTLFVQPDQRLAISYGLTMGFKVSVVSANGKRSDSLDVVVNTITDNYYVKWTNTKDYLGNMRQDFGTQDSVVVVSNVPIAQIKGMSGISGKTAPLDLTLDNVHLRGDTIIYKPSLYLKPDSTYGVDFDILFKDGNLRTNILGATWKTASKIQILAIDNTQSGTFRQFRTIGDSLTVTFSSAIDTSINAAVPFKVNMTDVKSRAINTRVRWDAGCKVATIFNNDTLPSADFDASPAYTSDAIYTRAVKSVTFNFITKDGEQAIEFQPKNETIELHTERGLCVVSANVLLTHDIRNDVDRNESTIDDFALDSSVRVTFNRALDTTAMRADTSGLSKFVGIKEGTAAVVSVVTFSSDAKTIIITPVANLKPLTSYYVWLKNVPGKGIAGAAAINKDSGSFSGKSSAYSLLDKAFLAK